MRQLILEFSQKFRVVLVLRISLAQLVDGMGEVSLTKPPPYLQKWPLASGCWYSDMGGCSAKSVQGCGWGCAARSGSRLCDPQRRHGLFCRAAGARNGRDIQRPGATLWRRAFIRCPHTAATNRFILSGHLMMPLTGFPSEPSCSMPTHVNGPGAHLQDAIGHVLQA